ncbi:CBS domain-containing protein [Bdellovibrio sp. HCB290]|uniref:CBS domain-containing protein n=1 Tax=Bdellovibrio sp. HCB290 TaxID=3394356 RepID=UPI0039B6C2D3
MKVKDIMRPRADVIDADRTVQEAALMMQKNSYGSLPVSRNDKMIGMITDRDITVRVVAAGLDPKNTRVEQCMSQGIRYCFDDEDLSVVAQQMIRSKIRRIPVVNRSKRLVGMVSLGDIATRGQNKNISHDLLSHVAQV